MSLGQPLDGVLLRPRPALLDTFFARIADVDSAVTIRPADPAELAAMAELRWHWLHEKARRAAVVHDEFVDAFVAWAHRHRDTHRSVVALCGEQVVGMAWMSIVDRVPMPGADDRASGDVQAVYVVPDQRDRGIGAALIADLVGFARARGLERVTVHSSRRAITAYQRGGFVTSDTLLHYDMR